ncbi:cyclic AMP-dependent transcription factor ATF-1 isoform X1 [Micropterus salmoides]|uniref:cyclic AMP-dependent transcription factor ATF-1 isoform X1 n=2 Tax=Micropterus salmoides TaxID=27706 RepID=UPI0018EA7048|nr:cyclic AMP-dependent transcription factor ATF-1 isoform X1 [Micropterus salmoides]XP_038553095.1 cyclic AMP-dependent transcription factor ATF-1 isoform X1 [Micropterus salmoides]XP_045932360.1 cyclic AMP-dependent transcription factor ATF-1 isoform X1 [Micropterus dolomieu]XP_045932361.1 cyclic AMP-dependent transcription factor ATF-1 isoform X1 [Micropterus dolomieu]XP_045932362.1 cyclic AMP-dependent transcription factor ATF-1 isoform X1 [Micropterus dolomieu]XP_045932363.1 cyclic AMP-de
MEEVQQGSNGTESQTTIIPTTITTSQFSQIAQQMSLGGSSVAVVQLPGGQFQVQGVIQSAQSSVIQSPQMQSSQVQGSDSEDSQDSSDSGVTAQKTREILARRPSYRKILNELSSEEMAHIEGKDNSPVSTGVTVPTTQIYQTSSGQYITIAANGTIQLATPGSEGIHGLQTVTMANSGGAQQGTTILQYAQTPDGQQILVPSNQVVVQGAGGEMQTYQIRTAPTSSSLSQTVVMTSPVGLSQGKTDDPTVKREIRLAKNREAARECRRKKKEYVKCLENRVAVLENQNKTLIEELKTLKDLYCVKTG